MATYLEKWYEEQSVVDLVTAINEFLKNAVPSQIKCVAESDKKYVEQTHQLILYTEQCRRRAHLPKYTRTSILEKLAVDKGFVFFDKPLDLFIHFTQLPKFWDTLKTAPKELAVNTDSVLQS